MEEKLPKVFKRRWVKALRSGKYKKGNTFLYNADTGTYCCLGVACVVAGASGFTNLGYIVYPIEGIEKIPALLRGSSGESIKLGCMNDDSTQSFETIADYIEKHL